MAASLKATISHGPNGSSVLTLWAAQVPCFLLLLRPASFNHCVSVQYKHWHLPFSISSHQAFGVQHTFFDKEAMKSGEAAFKLLTQLFRNLSWLYCFIITLVTKSFHCRICPESVLPGWGTDLPAHSAVNRDREQGGAHSCGPHLWWSCVSEGIFLLEGRGELCVQSFSSTLWLHFFLKWKPDAYS